jgi:hypothetical protein
VASRSPGLHQSEVTNRRELQHSFASEISRLVGHAAGHRDDLPEATAAMLLQGAEAMEEIFPPADSGMIRSRGLPGSGGFSAKASWTSLTSDRSRLTSLFCVSALILMASADTASRNCLEAHRDRAPSQAHGCIRAALRSAAISPRLFLISWSRSSCVSALRDLAVISPMVGTASTVLHAIAPVQDRLVEDHLYDLRLRDDLVFGCGVLAPPPGLQEVLDTNSRSCCIAQSLFTHGSLWRSGAWFLRSVAPGVRAVAVDVTSPTGGAPDYELGHGLGPPFGGELVEEVTRGRRCLAIWTARRTSAATESIGALTAGPLAGKFST